MREGGEKEGFDGEGVGVLKVGEGLVGGSSAVVCNSSFELGGTHRSLRCVVGVVGVV